MPTLKTRCIHIQFPGYIPARLNHPGMINDQCNGYLGNIPNTTITVLSPLAPGTTTSPTPSLNQTATITTSNNTSTDNSNRANNPTGCNYGSNGNRHTLGILLYPKTDRHDNEGFHVNSNQLHRPKSLHFGIEFSILAISAAILIVRSQYRKP